jgi:glycosyltransferase involved in cell wall biosynthesis
MLPEASGRMTMLRVLFVSHGHPALLHGGTEHFAHDLFTAIRDQGRAEAMFLGCVTPLHRASRRGGGLQAVGRGSDDVLLWIGGFDRWQMTQPHPGSSLTAFRELLQSFRPDIVHFQHLLLLGVEAIVLVRRVLPQARIVVSLHDYSAICANDGLLRTVPDGTPCLGGSIDACHACFPNQDPSRFALRRLHLCNVLGEVDRFIAPSHFLAERYVSWGLRRSLVQVIANGLPDLPSPPERSHARPRTRFAYFGNIAPHKGVLSLLEALPTVTNWLPDVRLDLYGAINFQSEEFRRSFDAHLAAAGPFARYHGPYRREDLPALMQAIDWVVTPSEWWENAPLTILEAFRSGRPVITADAGGMAELVDDGVNGLHFRFRQPDDLAQVMRRAAGNDLLWQQLTTGVPRVPNMHEISERHLFLYHSLSCHGEANDADESRAGQSAFRREHPSDMTDRSVADENKAL